MEAYNAAILVILHHNYVTQWYVHKKFPWYARQRD